MTGYYTSSTNSHYLTHTFIFKKLGELWSEWVKLFTPKSDQFQPHQKYNITNLAFYILLYSDDKWLYYQSSLTHSYFIDFSLNGWENVLFELASDRVSSSDEVRNGRIIIIFHLIELWKPKFFLLNLI